MKIGAELKTAREARGMTLRELGKQIAYSSTYITLVENDKKKPSPAYLSKVAPALRLSTNALLLKAGFVPPSMETDFANDPGFFAEILPDLQAITAGFEGDVGDRALILLALQDLMRSSVKSITTAHQDDDTEDLKTVMRKELDALAKKHADLFPQNEMDLTDKAPIAIREICERENIHIIEVDPEKVATGRAVYIPGAGVAWVFVNRGLNENHQREIIAHEAGHIFILRRMETGGSDAADRVIVTEFAGAVPRTWETSWNAKTGLQLLPTESDDAALNAVGNEHLVDWFGNALILPYAADSESLNLSVVCLTVQRVLADHGEDHIADFLDEDLWDAEYQEADVDVDQTTAIFDYGPDGESERYITSPDSIFPYRGELNAIALANFANVPHLERVLDLAYHGWATDAMYDPTSQYEPPYIHNDFSEPGALGATSGYGTGQAIDRWLTASLGHETVPDVADVMRKWRVPESVAQVRLIEAWLVAFAEATGPTIIDEIGRMLDECDDPHKRKIEDVTELAYALRRIEREGRGWSSNNLSDASELLALLWAYVASDHDSDGPESMDEIRDYVDDLV